MTKNDNMPIWVFLALMNIETKKGALILIWSSFAFGLLCIPLSIYQPFDTVDWTWIAMMAAITFWYWLSMKWVDKQSAWPDINA
jgi:hypothetical protein